MSGLQTSLKWLTPGLRVKRFIALGVAGLGLFMIGMGVITEAHGAAGRPMAIRVSNWVISHVHVGVPSGTFGAMLSVLGMLIVLYAYGRLIHSLTSVLDPELAEGGLVEVIYERRKLSKGRRIVVIGGGTGISTMLRGLKCYSSNITAIVTVADDGGSSGKLKKQLNILPPGDIRNCLVALADAEPQMTELFQYRFRDSVPGPGTGALDGEGHATAGGSSAKYGEGLRDHAFGNLLIAAMCAICNGDFERGVQETSHVLNIRGRVLPSTDTHVRLRAEMEDGSDLEGETTIVSSPLKIKRVSLVPADARPLPEVLDAIGKADIIIIGPGSVYTSILPNLLLRGVPEAIRRAHAKRVYICNVMTQPGETDGFSAYDHVKVIEQHTAFRVFDYVVVNTGQPGRSLLEKYKKSGSVLVEPDIDRIKGSGYRAIAGNFVNQTDVVRHDAGMLAAAIAKLLG